MEKVKPVSREATLNTNWWLVTINGVHKIIEAHTPANAVFAALRSMECNGEFTAMGEKRGNIEYTQVMKPKTMSKAAFRRAIIG